MGTQKFASIHSIPYLLPKPCWRAGHKICQYLFGWLLEAQNSHLNICGVHVNGVLKRRLLQKHGWINKSRRTDMLWRGWKKKKPFIDGKAFKKSPSIWSFRDYLFEAYGKTFTQCRTLHTHNKYHCKVLETQRIPKEECPKCSKMVSKTTNYSHAKNGYPKPRGRPA